MTVSESFDGLIEYIERLVDDPYISKNDLRERVIKKSGMNGRDLDGVFNFLLGSTVRQYICDRKMMAAYAHLMEKNSAIGTAVSIFGYVDASTSGFNHEFKKKFGCTPKEAMAKKDRSKLEPPSYWNRISGIVVKEKKSTSPRSFSPSMSPEEAQKAQEVWAWKAYYDLDGVFSDYACDLAERMDCSLEKAFYYVNDLRDIGIGIIGWEENEDDTPIISKTQLMEFGNDPFFRCMFFERGVLPSIAVRYDKHYFSIPPVPRAVVAKATPDAVRVYHPFCVHYCYLPFELFVQGWDFYHAHADARYTEEDLVTFYDILQQCYSVEEAFYSFVPSDDFPTDEEWDAALSSSVLDEAEMYHIERGEDPNTVALLEE